MRYEQGDLWDHWERGNKIVVTTNVGWDLQTRRNNMGAGMALQAAQRWPWLPEWYGNLCRLYVTRWGQYGPHARPAIPRCPARWMPVVELDHLRLLFLPVKPLLDFADPERSWDQTARLDLIRWGLRQLTRHHGQIALAYPGCGNGGLDKQDVAPFMEALPDRFTVCDWGFPVAQRAG